MTKDDIFLVVDDHEMVLKGTLNELEKHFPETKLLSASTVNQAWKQIEKQKPNLLLLDLSLPKHKGQHAQTDIGLNLLKTVMETHNDLNITIQSSYTQRLITIISRIECHAGGFTIASKDLSTSEIITRIRWALQGLTHTKDLRRFRSGVELRPEWLTVLQLAFEEGLQDKAIAEKMSISQRTVRVYMTKLQDALDIYPEDGNGQLNLRTQTGIVAREMGLIE